MWFSQPVHLHYKTSPIVDIEKTFNVEPQILSKNTFNLGRTNGTANPKKEKIERTVRRYSLITETSYSNSYKLSKVQIKKKCTHEEVIQ